jgi:hypothetical protein
VETPWSNLWRLLRGRRVSAGHGPFGNMPPRGLRRIKRRSLQCRRGASRGGPALLNESRSDTRRGGSRVSPDVVCDGVAEVDGWDVGALRP